MELKLIERGNPASVAKVAVEDVTLNKPHLVMLSGSVADVVSAKRNGQNLVLALASGKQIVLYGFFEEDEEGEHSELVVEGENDELLWLNENQEFVGISPDAPLLEGVGAATTSEEAIPVWLMGLLGAVGVAGIAIAADSGGEVQRRLGC